MLYRREDAWLIADTNSKSGVMVNGTKIDKPTPCLLYTSLILMFYSFAGIPA